MIRLERISRDTAEALLDFTGGAALVPPDLARQQLDGAVALYNALASERVGYVADEVGLGKTYVALGAVALLRWFHPHARILFVAPRENIQSKWIKELHNLADRNWRHSDQRVRDLRGRPARPVVRCASLLDLARQVVHDPDRDFFTRLTSFSFALGSDTSAWRARREELCRLSAVVDRSDLDLRRKDEFKEGVARSINRLLPHFDLVVVDEAHNLKHGRDGSASRNRILSLVLGTADDARLERRCDRALLLSATPMETDFAELWRQLDLFGVGDGLRELERGASDERKREVARRFLFRRVGTLRYEGTDHTKNEYRREWRAGGCHAFDEPLAVPDARQRLVVALVQKKVAEVLQDPEFGARFQVGMLASFESFAQTAKIESSDGDAAVFDQSEQTSDEAEREGIDRAAVNALATSHRRRFREPMPHPKMDAVVRSLAAAMARGEKSLVFVRRVRSVPEIADKLCREYDAWLVPSLRERLGPELFARLRAHVDAYERERRPAAWEEVVDAGATASESETGDSDASAATSDDRGGRETFFSYFFRGRGPAGVLSGAAFRKNRLDGEGSAFSVFFEDNHVTRLLGSEHDVLGALASIAGTDRERLRERLRASAFALYRASSTGKKPPRRRVFKAYQAAALHVVAASGSPLASEARLVLDEAFPGVLPAAHASLPASWPDAEEHLVTKTFFTELRGRERLRQELWPVSAAHAASERFRDAERRRELLSAVARLGHAFIDLWILAVQRLGSLDLNAQERSTDASLVTQYLDLLESQRDRPGLTAWRELSEVGRHHDLILGLNFPEARSMRVGELARLFGSALGSQAPVGGMWGGVNKSLVGQFRMPGYPLVLVTTDVLQEGEDLHAFCSRVVHYGITWTPSAMEQRTGRIDRIGSLAHRRLSSLGDAPAAGEDLLQVHYPYLEDTIEVLQVDRVLERMNRFLRSMHDGPSDEDHERTIDTREGFARGRARVRPLEGTLRTAFPVRDDHLQGWTLDPRIPLEHARELREHLVAVREGLASLVRVAWEADDTGGELRGRVFVDGAALLGATDSRAPDGRGVREQAVRLSLRTHGAEGVPALHAASQVGVLDLTGRATEIMDIQSALAGVKACALPWTGGSHLVTVEGDLFFGKAITQMNEVVDLVTRVALGADRIERELFEGIDADPAEHWAVLRSADDVAH